MAFSPLHLLSSVFAALTAWSVYRRMRRHIGPQKFRPKWIVFRICFLLGLVVVIGILSRLHRPYWIGFSAGLLIGLPIARAGYLLTRFQSNEDGRFFIPNPYIGAILCVLFVARIGYRLLTIYFPVKASAAVPANLMATSVTLVMFGILASYYIAYYLRLCLHFRKIGKTQKIK
jgi:hypothetical protein